MENFKWIDVKKYLPKDNGYGESDYLALWLEGGEIENPYWMQGRYDHCKKRFHTMEDENGEYEILKNVTHWAVVPELNSLYSELSNFRKWLFKTYENNSTFGEMLCDNGLVESYLSLLPDTAKGEKNY